MKHTGLHSQKNVELMWTLYYNNTEGRELLGPMKSVPNGYHIVPFNKYFPTQPFE